MPVATAIKAGTAIAEATAIRDTTCMKGRRRSPMILPVDGRNPGLKAFFNQRATMKKAISMATYPKPNASSATRPPERISFNIFEPLGGLLSPGACSSVNFSVSFCAESEPPRRFFPEMKSDCILCPRPKWTGGLSCGDRGGDKDQPLPAADASICDFCAASKQA